MDLGISGRIAFVAGGSKGMGFAAARFLAAEGCKVALVARERDAIDHAVGAINALGGTAFGVSADLATEAGVKHAAAAVRDALGRPDICISQTRSRKLGRFFDHKPEVFQEAFASLAMHVVWLARELLPDMRANRWGRFVHVGTTAAKEAVSDIPHIVMNTVAPSIMGFLKSLSDEFAGEGITFNSVGPGWCNTKAMEQLMIELGRQRDGLDQWLSETTFIPAGRSGTPDELGSMIAYLCSDLAGYCTGEWITVDGGRHRATL